MVLDHFPVFDREGFCPSNTVNWALKTEEDRHTHPGLRFHRRLCHPWRPQRQNVSHRICSKTLPRLSCGVGHLGVQSRRQCQRRPLQSRHTREWVCGGGRRKLGVLKICEKLFVLDVAPRGCKGSEVTACSGTMWRYDEDLI